MKPHHELKLWPPYMAALRNGAKTFDIRREDDRRFIPGQLINFREWDPSRDAYTGEFEVRIVTYVLRDFPGIEEGYAIIALKVPERMTIQRIGGEDEVVYV